ncbi:hypothetical protein HanXRQr2_Chr10g0452321 [Helianthus annuus]|uniref:Uncharacterized protein n=1 Tax=Helianthus annuus TaxID=4232 RepID=A0A9K3N5D3_HELAN|nr:hypothetical protein HanXRQr2_Chr10g0452321 [Helianthus annuus]
MAFLIGLVVQMVQEDPWDSKIHVILIHLPWASPLLLINLIQIKTKVFWAQDQMCLLMGCRSDYTTLWALAILVQTQWDQFHLLTRHTSDNHILTHGLQIRLHNIMGSLLLYLTYVRLLRHGFHTRVLLPI